MRDWDLLQEYRQTASEEAFSELVRRHLDMVYSVAWRQLGDLSGAQEVAQAVFCLLARKARQFRPEVPVGAWLYQSACFKSAEYRRAETRRRRREGEACAMDETARNTREDEVWERLAPLLEEAVRHLSEADRQVVVLRFFERKSLRDVGLALQLEEGAAAKRVSRAVERLRTWFARRGVTCPAGALGAVLLAHAVQAAPTGWVASLSKAAVAAAGSAALPAIGAWSGFFSMTTKQTLGVVSLAVACGLPSAWLWQQNRALRQELAGLHASAAETERERKVTTGRTAIQDEEIAALRSAQREVVRLRGQVAQLRQAASESPGQPTATVAPLPTRQVVSNSLSARVPLGNILAVGGWTADSGPRTLALVQPTLEEARDGSNKPAILTQSTFLAVPDDVWNRLGLANPPTGTGQENYQSLLDGDQAERLLTTLTSQPGVRILSRPRIAQPDGVAASIRDGDDANHQEINLVPRLTETRQEVDLQIGIELTSTPLSTNTPAQSGP